MNEKLKSKLEEVKAFLKSELALTLPCWGWIAVGSALAMVGAIINSVLS